MDGEARKPARERILDTAAELFYRDGIRAVGIDTIIARSGVAKMSLYRNFASKDDLVSAYLERFRTSHRHWWDRVEGRHPDSPRAALGGLFVSLGHWLAHPQFAGCPFAIALRELRDEDNPAHRTAVAHKQEMRDRLTRLARSAGAAEPERLGLQLAILMDGAYAGGPGHDAQETAQALVAAAETLIEAGMPKGDAGK